MTTRGPLALMMGMTLLLAACAGTSEPDPRLDLSQSLVGVWVLEGEDTEGIQVFARAAAFSGDHPGYEFGEHGGLRVRKPGRCGTPPITWTDHEGLWSLLDNRLLDICHAWRGSPQEYQLEIMSLGPRRLTCRVRTDPGS